MNGYSQMGKRKMIRAEGTALQRKKGKNRTVLVKTVFTDVQKTTVWYC